MVLFSFFSYCLKFLKTLKNKQQTELEVLYLLQGRVFPDYIEKEFGISQQLSIKALSKTSGLSNEEIIKHMEIVSNTMKNMGVYED